jgi:hypothetical protein
LTSIKAGGLGRKFSRKEKLHWVGGGFFRHHEDRLVTNQGKKIALNRSNWMTLPNIKQMYKVIYNEMVDARVAVTLQNPIFADMSGKPEDDKTKRFGLKQNIKITKPK